MNKTIKYLMLACIFTGMLACTSQKNPEIEEHYYLKGYDHLVFRDTLGNAVSPSQYIRPILRNGGYRTFVISDTSLMLENRHSGEPYSGYIRTYYENSYNLQGEYEDGKIFRLRFWYPNHTLGLDADYKDGTYSVWSSSGSVLAEKTPTELYYFYPGENTISEIISDTMRSHYDREGNLERYSIYTDTAIIGYNGDGKKVSMFPYWNDKGMDGEFKEWHPNGQLKVSGWFENGKERGTWIRYDSLGNEISREVLEP